MIITTIFHFQNCPEFIIFLLITNISFFFIHSSIYINDEMFFLSYVKFFIQIFIITIHPSIHTNPYIPKYWYIPWKHDVSRRQKKMNEWMNGSWTIWNFFSTFNYYYYYFSIVGEKYSVQNQSINAWFLHTYIQMIPKQNKKKMIITKSKCLVCVYV